MSRLATVATQGDRLGLLRLNSSNPERDGYCDLFCLNDHFCYLLERCLRDLSLTLTKARHFRILDRF